MFSHVTPCGTEKFEETECYRVMLPLSQRTAKGASGKGPRQKKAKSVKTIFDTSRHFSRRAKKTQKVLGPAFGRTDLSRIFIFEPPDFFADFLAGFFLLIFVGKSAQKNPPGKSPGKSSKIYTTKILQHISADCPGQKSVKKFSTLFDIFCAAPVFRPLLGDLTPGATLKLCSQSSGPLKEPKPNFFSKNCHFFSVVVVWN